jgi:hypothetical protein
MPRGCRLLPALALALGLSSPAAAQPPPAAVELGLVPPLAPTPLSAPAPCDGPSPRDFGIYFQGGTETGVRLQYTFSRSGPHAWLLEASSAIPLIFPVGLIPSAGLRYQYACHDGPCNAFLIAPGVRAGGIVVVLPFFGVGAAPAVAADVTFSWLNKRSGWETGVDLGAACLFGRRGDSLTVPVASFFTGFRF